MLGTFLGLETATRGLQAMQAAIETAAHNIDNANTPGYTRQRVELVASTPLPDPSLPSAVPGQIGTGVQVEKIARLRDSFLDSQYWAQNQYLGQWTVQQDTLQKISAIINEPSDTGLATVMQNFWNAWDKLSANPSDLSARTLVVQTGVTVAQTLNQMAKQLSSLQADLTTSLQDTVDQVNSYLTQIARLNQQIDSVEASRDQPNDLLDQRGYLLDQLSNLVDISVKSDSTTRFQLSIGGTVVLNDQSVMAGSISITANANDAANISQVLTFDLTGKNHTVSETGTTTAGAQVTGTVDFTPTDLSGITGPVTITVDGQTFDITNALKQDWTGKTLQDVESALGNVTSSGGVKLSDVVNISDDGKHIILTDKSPNATKPSLQYVGGSNPLSIPVNGGKLKGLIDSLVTVQNYQADLDAFANALANGPITITLAGDWTFNAGNTGTQLPVAVTYNNTLYSSNDPTYNAQQLKIDTKGSTYTDSNGNVFVTIPKGTTLTVNGLNALQQMGYDENSNSGKPFFIINPTSSGTNLTAANIAVNPALTSDVSKLAAGLSASPGDGTLAITISSMKNAQAQFSPPSGSTGTMPLTQGTLDSFLQAVVGQLGVQGQQANQEVANQQALLQQIDMQRQSVAGVSIDEEMANIIRYQQAYNASAKVISVINDLLNTLMQNV